VSADRKAIEADEFGKTAASAKNKIWKIVGYLLLAIFLLILVSKILWVSNFYVNGDDLISGRARDDLLSRYAFLKEAITLKNEERPDKQWFLEPKFQGEWAITTCSMYSMALCNLGFLYPKMRYSLAQELRTLIERVCQRSYQQFDIDAWNQDPFDSLESGNGHVWYLAHLNLMITCYRLLGGNRRYDSLTNKISEALARQISRDAAMTAQTYPGERYIPDNSVLLASLKNHDIIFGTHYSDLISKWRRSAVPKLIDLNTGTLVCAVSEEAKRKSASRSSGAAFSLVYLFHADPQFFEQQYPRLKQAFAVWLIPELGKFVGASALKENSDGSWKGDIDSGPVLFGLSTSGTGFGIGCARAAKDSQFLSQLLLTAEIIGSSVESNGKRHYLLAPLVGEAIMLAMKTTTVWDNRYVKKYPISF